MRSCYSAHEHSSLLNSIASHASTTSSSSPIATALPLDITVESLVAVALICIGLVFGAEPLKPISWRVWAGNIEREAREGRAGASGANPFAGLETRTGFLDIRVS
jgi:membrane magnesium transporter 1